MAKVSRIPVKEKPTIFYVNVHGSCPMGCGHTLFVGSGGYVTCSYIHCPQPDSASRMLENAPKLRKQFEEYIGG